MAQGQKANIESIIERNGGIMLDIGCGESKQPNFVGMDMRELPGVDIVHDAQVFPYPLPDECCLFAMASHLYEHLDPSNSLRFMDEVWRLLKPGRQFAIAMPYGVSRGYVQDPTHKNPANEDTWTYFDPRFPLYRIYKPKPWIVDNGFPVWQVTGNMEVVLRKPMPDELAKIEASIQEGKLYGEE